MQENQLDQETNMPTTTNQAVNSRDESGRFTVGNKPIVGFHTHPERRSNGRWSKETSISYCYRQLLAMTNDEFQAFTPITQAQRIAKRQIERAMKDNSESLAVTKEITNRTEGRPRQDVGIETDEKAVPIIRGFVIPTFPDEYIDEQITRSRVKSTSRPSS